MKKVEYNQTHLHGHRHRHKEVIELRTVNNILLCKRILIRLDNQKQQDRATLSARDQLKAKDKLTPKELYRTSRKINWLTVSYRLLDKNKIAQQLLTSKDSQVLQTNNHQGFQWLQINWCRIIKIYFGKLKKEKSSTTKSFIGSQ